MASPTHKDLFLASLERCASSPTFMEMFYERFMASSDEVRQKFRYTDMSKQRQMLLASLRMAAGATQGDRESLKELHERARTHDRWHHNIEPKLYGFWLDALVTTASTVDSEWSDEIEESWRLILGHVFDTSPKATDRALRRLIDGSRAVSERASRPDCYFSFLV